jgi:hypothetical protein
MRLIRVNSFSRIAAFLAVLVTMSACGGDSTGPSNLDSSAALASLRLGLGGVADLSAPEAATLNASLDAIAPILDQISVNIGGSSHSMFALGFRESFPAGTCEENVFVDPDFPPAPGDCTPITPEVGIILWQSHSASAAPDRLIVIAADAGNNSFPSIADASSLTGAVAIYIEGQDKFWISTSGTLSNQVAATNQSCGLPQQPPYAAAGSCSIATFTENGVITLALLSDIGDITSTHTNLTISSQTFNGFWESVTQVQPVTLNTSTLNVSLRMSRLLGR